MAFKTGSLVWLFLLSGIAQASPSDSANVMRRKLWIAAGVTTAAYGGTLTWLSKEWYSNYDRSAFHWFNDNNEWLQLDKCGHAYTAYQESAFAIRGLQRMGLPHKKAVLMGGLTGFILQSPIEILDGYSAAWGASWGDLTANAAGSLIATASAYYGVDDKVFLKFSWVPTNESKIRPNVLGSSFPEQVLKNYNGQTYWLSFHPSLLTSTLKKWPKWLNLCVGYGARGMVGANSNQFYVMREWQNYAYIQRSRQFYFSLDLNLRAFHPKRAWARTALDLVNLIRIPLPALAYDRVQGIHYVPWGN